MGWLELAGVDVKVKALLALLAVLALVVPPLALLRDEIGLKAALAIIAASYAGFYLAFDRMAALLLSGAVGVARVVERVAEEVAGEGEDEAGSLEAGEGPESLLEGEDFEIPRPSNADAAMLWGLATSLYREMGGKLDVQVIIYDDEAEVAASYPSYPHSEEEYIVVDDDLFTAVVDEGRVKVVTDVFSAAPLVRALRRGEGDTVVVEDEDEAMALYSLAKALASATLSEGLEGLAPYLAYKAIVKLQRRGLIRFTSREVADLLPFEDKRTWSLVRQQVAEEIGASKKGA